MHRETFAIFGLEIESEFKKVWIKFKKKEIQRLTLLGANFRQGEKVFIRSRAKVLVHPLNGP